jgi:hypothetical protein
MKCMWYCDCLQQKTCYFYLASTVGTTLVALGEDNGVDSDTSDNNDNLHTTMHNPHQFWCESHRPLKVVGVPCAPGHHAVA